MIAGGTARAGYIETNLVSNGLVPAQVTDPNLQGAWGLSFSTGSPFWVSDQAPNFNNAPNVNNIGAATVYTVSNTATPTAVKDGLTVAILNQNGAPPNPNATGPTGEVSTSAPGITTASTDFVVGTNQWFPQFCGGEIKI
jgi:hypothetical protein